MKKIEIRRCVVLVNERNNILFTEDIREIEVSKDKNYKKGDRLDKEDSPQSNDPNEYYVVL